MLHNRWDLSAQALSFKLAVAALIAGAVVGGVEAGRAQVVSGGDVTTITSTTIAPASASAADVATPQQTG
jgi:hypothetical protein